MSAGDRKRKRDTDATAAEKQPRKTRVLDNVDESKKSRGQSRQEKSERRSKKTKQADTKVKAREEVIEATSTVGSKSTSQNGEDTIASGHDFVPLLTDPSNLPNGEKPAESTAETPKKRKPKSKAKSAGKKQDLPSEEDTTNTTKSTVPTKFIVFVGNLPYSVTTKQIESHFAKLAPFKVRHNTDKKTGKSKGFAFLEFENYDRMKTCLQLYHHSIFDPDSQHETGEEGEGELVSKMKRTGRRINVELTAGGGGKGKQREERIKSKNRKLAEERERRLVKNKADRVKATQERRDKPATGVNADREQDDTAGIHPARLKRMKR